MQKRTACDGFDTLLPWWGREPGDFCLANRFVNAVDAVLNSDSAPECARETDLCTNPSLTPPLSKGGVASCSKACFICEDIAKFSIFQFQGLGSMSKFWVVKNNGGPRLQTGSASLPLFQVRSAEYPSSLPVANFPSAALGHDRRLLLLFPAQRQLPGAGPTARF